MRYLYYDHKLIKNKHKRKPPREVQVKPNNIYMYKCHMQICYNILFDNL